MLLAAFLIAILFTISGVTRRTREFGTLKAIGWSNRRIVGQVTGESLVQGLIGGAVGVAIGLDRRARGQPRRSDAERCSVGGSRCRRQRQAAPVPERAGRMPQRRGPGPAGGFGQAASAAASTDITLQAPVTLERRR